MRRAGFTLLELLVSLGLLGVFLWVGSVQFHGAPSGAATHALAERLAQALRTARHQAITSQMPVAVVFPSGNGTVPHCSGWYHLSGEEHPERSRPSRTDTDFPGTVICLGLWGPAALSAVAPPGANADGQTLDRWVDPPINDFILQFQPSGVAISNQLPRWGEDYRILVSQSVGYTSATPASVGPLDSRPGYFQISQVYQPYTITVTPMGGVTVQQGVQGGAAGSPTVLDHAPPLPAPAALPPALTPAGSHPPRFVEILRRPDSMPIQKNGHLQLTVYASDEDGGPLFLSGTGGGQFAQPGETRMRWNAVRRCWQGELFWQAPLDVGDSTVPVAVPVACVIRDPENHSTTSTASQCPDVQIRGTDYLVTNSGNTPEFFRFFLPSGTMLGNAYPSPNRTGRPCDIASDGQSLAYSGLDAASGLDGVTVGSLDGSQVDAFIPGVINPRFSEDGSQLVVRHLSSNVLAVVTLSDRVVHDLTEDIHPGVPILGQDPTFASTSARLAYLSLDRKSLMIADYLRNTQQIQSPHELFHAPPGASFTGAARFSGDDGHLAVGLTNKQLVLYDLNASRSQALTPSIPAAPYSPCFSPDGLKLAFRTHYPNHVYVHTLGGSDYLDVPVPVGTFSSLCWAQSGQRTLRR